MKAVANIEKVDHFTETITPTHLHQSRFTIRDGTFLFSFVLAVVILARMILGN